MKIPQAVLQASEHARTSNLVWLEECGHTSFESHSENWSPVYQFPLEWKARETIYVSNL